MVVFARVLLRIGRKGNQYSKLTITGGRMRQVVQFLLFASRVLALCAVLAGLAAGLLQATIGATIICVDSCPPRDAYFSDLGPIAVRIMTPCVVLEVLALVAFVAYCLATRQARRVVMP